MQWWLVAIGAGCGGLLRLAFAPLNSWHSVIPLGTWSANLLGGLLMGVVVGLGSKLSPELRYLLATGFLGGLTTFSTFSAESFALLQQGRWQWARWAAIAQVVGVLVGWAAAQYPVLLAPGLTVANAASPVITLQWIAPMVVAGSALLFPSLFWLLRTFKAQLATH